MTITARLAAQPASNAAPDTAFARDMVAALSRTPHRIAPKYFYDAAGSALFDQICELPEYYVTRTEHGILTRHAQDIARHIGPGADLIEFGAGSSVKVRLLLDALVQPRRYVPIDISGEHLHQSADALRALYPGLEVRPVAADFMMPLSLPPALPEGGRRVGVYLGSSLGNYEPHEALRFLQMAAGLLLGGGLLIGVDLLKDPAILHAAYNDADGITAAFNRNLLARANRELDADFDLASFCHHACYQPLSQRMEMHLISRTRQTVRVCDQVFELAEGESIHTENSHKFTLDGFKALACEAGFTPGPVWLDERRWFALHWLRCDGPGTDGLRLSRPFESTVRNKP